MPATPTDDLLERLKDPEYAKLYGEENAKVDFAITLIKARKSLNLTQRNLAEKLNISQLYLAKLERGEANPTLGTIGRLLAALNLRLVTGTAPLMPEPMPSGMSGWFYWKLANIIPLKFERLRGFFLRKAFDKGFTVGEYWFRK